MRHRFDSTLVSSLALVAFSISIGCGSGYSSYDEALGQVQQPLTVPGPWQIPGDVRAVGDTQSVTYTGAGPWVGSSGCYGNLSPGAGEMREFLYQAFPALWHIGGYACRSIRGNDSVMSVHATGRALDLHVNLEGGDADNGSGDPVGNWLIVHAEEIGIQYIIWDQWTWGAHRDPGSKDRAYGGQSPHKDHLHIELSSLAGERARPGSPALSPFPRTRPASRSWAAVASSTSRAPARISSVQVSTGASSMTRATTAPSSGPTPSRPTAPATGRGGR